MNNFWLNVLKIIICIVLIILLPFAFPLIARFFIHIHLYENLEIFKEYMNIFLNKYFLMMLGIILAGLLFIICDKEAIKKWIDERDFLAKFKDAQFEAKRNDIIDESNKKKNFINSLSSNNQNNDKNITSEVQEELKLIKSEQNKKDKNNKNNNNEIQMLKDENNNLRFYSAYNIINQKTKELLNVVYCDKSMKLEDFKNALIRSFKNRNKRNKNLTNSQKNEYANNKYDTIKDGLQYLNIIEISDDNKTITLTQYGKEFVEKYIEKEVRENEN